MTPEDDAGWPGCPFHGNTVNWCEERRLHFLNGLDIVSVGTRICVPVVPDWNQWAEVSIDTAQIAPGIAYACLVKSAPFSDNEELIQVGMWTEGEGRASLSGVILDWVKANSTHDMECPSTSHNFQEEVSNTKYKAKDSHKYQMTNAWSILMYDMCISCRMKFNQAFGGSSETFGLDQVEEARPQTRNARMEAIRRKVGNGR